MGVSKVESLSEHLSGRNNLPSMLNKRSTGTDGAGIARSLFARLAYVDIVQVYI